MTKDELHRLLDELIPADTVSRSNLRIIGHALIELGLLTTMECGWEHCKEDTREFIAYGPSGRGQKSRHRRTPSVDHVVSKSDGGSDLPSNIQIIHFSCNSAKGSRDARKNPEVQRKISEALSKRWDDPEYRNKMIAASTAANRDPETRERKAAKMRERWKDPLHREKVARNQSQRQSIPSTCDECGLQCKSAYGLKSHVTRKHKKDT